jgi:DnaA family protein
MFVTVIVEKRVFKQEALVLTQGILTLSSPNWHGLSDFYALHQQGEVERLLQWMAAKHPSVCWIVGEGVCGKTHLAQALLTEQTQQGVTCAYISGKEASRLSPDIVHGLEQLQLVCFDDVELLWSKPEWRVAMAAMVKRMTDSGVGVLLVQRALPDTNQPAGLIVPLLAIEDTAIKRQLLLMRADRLDLRLPASLTNWLLKHFASDLAQLFHVLDYLDKASLTLKRPLTLPLAKKILLF